MTEYQIPDGCIPIEVKVNGINANGITQCSPYPFPFVPQPYPYDFVVNSDNEEDSCTAGCLIE